MSEHRDAGVPQVSRRRFSAVGGATAAVAAAAGVGGQLLPDKRFSVRASTVKIGQVKAPGLARGTEITDIPGLSSLYTPDASFYRVDSWAGKRWWQGR